MHAKINRIATRIMDCVVILTRTEMRNYLLHMTIVPKTLRARLPLYAATDIWELAKNASVQTDRQAARFAPTASSQAVQNALEK